MVDHRRGGDGGCRSEEGVARPHERAREPVRREDGGAHDERVQDLRELVADGDAAGEPGGRLRERGERRREEERLAADEEPVPGRERLRELRVEDLVREDRGRDVAQRGNRVVGGGDGEERREEDPGRERPWTRGSRDVFNRLRARHAPSGRLQDRGKESVHATRIGSYGRRSVTLRRTGFRATARKGARRVPQARKPLQIDPSDPRTTLLGPRFGGHRDRYSSGGTMASAEGTAANPSSPTTTS